MLSARNAIIACLAVAGLSMLITALRWASPPDSNGLGLDSYGVRRYGLKGLHDTLKELKIPVKRSLLPPTALLSGNPVVFICEPDGRTVAFEPDYLRKLGEWVEGGGIVVFSPSRSNLTLRSDDKKRSERTMDGIMSDLSVLEALGLDGVQLDKVNLPLPDGTPREDTDSDRGTRHYNRSRTRPTSTRHEPSEMETVRVSSDGSLLGLRDRVVRLRLPSVNLRVIDPASDLVPDGRVFFEDKAGNEHTIVADYNHGEGLVTVISDSELVLNMSLAHADNPVLAVSVLARSGREVVFDEFYHGLTMRGNPLWLLTRHPYGLITILLLGATLLWVWRARSVLGPPLQPAEQTRRSVVEYVDAMARLFHRSGHRKFVLQEMREGVLWSLCRKVHLPIGTRSAERVAQALAARDKENAVRFRDANRMTADLVAKKREPDMGSMIRNARELNACL